MRGQAAINDREISSLWRAFYASLIIEDLLSDSPPITYLGYDYEDGVLCVEHVEEGLLRYLEEEYGGVVRIRAGRCGGELGDLEGFNERLAFATLQIVRRIFYERINEAAKEFALLLPYKADDLIVIEGQEDRVSVPSFPTFVFFHTHPLGTCLFSDKDWRSLVEFILNGGFVNGVISKECAFTAYRTGPLNESDVLKIIDFVEKRRYLVSPLVSFYDERGKAVLKSMYIR